jgi:4-hydroxy 2-oxovalerate aldolase
MTKDKAPTADATGAKGFLGYRPQIKVLDCTVRDGGLMNDHQFGCEFVRAVYDANRAAGVDYMEFGYKGDQKVYARDKFGVWKHCTEDDLRRVVEAKDPNLKISVMADAERTDYHTDILPKDKSVIDMVRVATYIHQLPTALDMIRDAHDKGYETCLNIMAISTVPEVELDAALEQLAQSAVGTLYVVDSFGTLYSEQIEYLVKKFLAVCKPAGKEVGIHTHNNMQLAFANTIHAIILGANMLDASFAGLGRGAGNCQMELLLSFLHNPKFNLRPVLECVQHTVEPMRAKLRWGFAIPYMVTGYLNQHPRTAMKFMEETDGVDVVKFYDTALEEE